MSYVKPGDIHILGQSRAFLDLMDEVSLVAPLNRPVLVVGERGTGKELIAARIHFLSKRWDKAFIKLNCAALPETLLESELFGYEPGAFTGATTRRKGRFELAHTGSLFLDEVPSMSQAAQEKLLRVIEYGQFERIGGAETLEVDVRVVAAANVDLPNLAERGAFRPDLLDRLAFDVLTVPPLRERREDILELGLYFARTIAHELDWPDFPGFAPRAEEILMSHSWPGNVRELKNAVERAVYKASAEKKRVETITLDPFESPYRPGSAPAPASTPAKAGGTPASSSPAPPASAAAPAAAGKPLDFKGAVADYQRTLLEGALKANRFHQKAAARHLRLSYDQFRHALKKHGLA
jgi:psp operon transcriptional activator